MRYQEASTREDPSPTPPRPCGAGDSALVLRPWDLDFQFNVEGFPRNLPSSFQTVGCGRLGSTMPRQAQRRQGTSERDDAALITRTLNGETEGFEQLMAKYANLVGSIAYNIVG